MEKPLSNTIMRLVDLLVLLLMVCAGSDVTGTRNGFQYSNDSTMIGNFLRNSSTRIGSVALQSCALPTSQYESLRSLYFSTNGSSWCYPDFSVPWNFTVSVPNAPCEDRWYGIECSCDNLSYSITSLNIYDVCAYGRIPSEISGLSGLVYLNLSLNYIDGTIPQSLSLLTSLKTLALSNNSLEGTIPSSLFHLQKLTYLSLGVNRLHGSVPSTISNLTNLYEIYLQENKLTGTIPLSLTELPSISIINLFLNYFTGTIPQSLGQITTLRGFAVDQNFLSGRVPSSISNCTLLLEFYVDVNLLTGPLPDIEKLKDISYLLMSQNSFTGTIPTTIQTLSKLISIGLFSNFLTGLLPPQGLNLTQLSQVLVNDNMLTGNPFADLGNLDLSMPLSPNNSLKLEVLSLTNNFFTGTISPNAFIVSPYISNLALGSNCMYGSIPSTICALRSSLKYLDLSSLGGNPACPVNLSINKNRPPLVNGVFSAGGLSGTIEPCIFLFEDLLKVNIFSNSLTGTLPELSNASKLIYLSAANNLLTGHIPNSIQLHEFRVLDLSSNKLDGTLVDSFVVSPLQTQLSLSVNRLSGYLPASIAQLADPNSSTSLHTLEVLASNIFDCDNNYLPAQDPYSRSYSCGSYDFNVASYIWVSGFGFFALILATVYLVAEAAYQPMTNLTDKFMGMYDELVVYWDVAQRLLQEAPAKSLKWPSPTIIKEAKGFLVVLQVLRRWSIFTAALLLIVVLTYVSIHSRNSIVSHDYGYIISVAFLHGETPVSVIFIIQLVTQVIVLVVILKVLSVVIKPLFADEFSNLILPSNSAHCQRSAESTSSPMMSRTRLVRKYLLVPGIHAVNVAVAILINSLYVASILSSQLNRSQLLLIQACIAVFKFMWSVTYIPVSTTSFLSDHTYVSSMQHRIIMLITNFILAPCIATFIVNESCFYYVFTPADEVISDTLVTECGFFFPCGASLTNICCSSTYGIIYLTKSVPAFQYSYACGTALLVSYGPVLLYAYIFYGLFIPIAKMVVLYFPAIPDKALKMFNMKYVLHVRGRDIVVRVVLHMTVLLTFGIALPALGVTIIVAILLDCYHAVIVTGKILHEDNGVSVAVVNPINESEASDTSYACNNTPVGTLDIQDSWYGLYVCFPYLVCTSAAFWAFLFFDMIADFYGITPGLIVSLVYCVVVPVLVLGLYYLLFPASSHVHDSVKQMNQARDESSDSSKLMRPPTKFEVAICRLMGLHVADSVLSASSHGSAVIASSPNTFGVHSSSNGDLGDNDL